MNYGAFVAVGWGFVALERDVHAFAVDFAQGLEYAFIVEGSEDDTFAGDFGVEDAALFGFLADVIPDIVVECGFCRGRTKIAEDIRAGGDAGSDLGELVVFEHVAALRDGGGAGASYQNYRQC